MDEIYELRNKLARAGEENAALVSRIAELAGTRPGSAAAEQERSENHLELVMSAIRLGTWDYSPLSGELTWSEECRAIYGLPEQEPVSFELFEKLIYPDDKDHALGAIASALDPGADGSYDISFRIIRYDNGTVRWIRSQGQVYRNAAGQPDRFIGTVLDITENKASEEKGAMLAAIVKSSDDAIISKSLNGIITSWNDAAQRIFGYTPEEIIGESILRLIPKDRLEEEPAIISQIRSGKRVNHFETKRLTKSGKLIDISLTISPVRDMQGRIIGVSKIARDITDRKLDEARKNDFIAMVSHELKTPLTSIKSYVQVLLAKERQNGDEFKLNALTRTDLQVKKMVSMISDFLNLARLEVAAISINKRPFELAQVIATVVEDFKFQGFGEHRISVNSCPARVFADPDKIAQVMTNLLSNAAKYSPGGGDITVGCEPRGRSVRVYVRDQGIGLSAAEQEKIFDRFHRVESDRAKTVSGFGVGLYLVSELLKYHGSEIRVESAEGSGSIFYFDLETV